jgi:hypothetical protein
MSYPALVVAAALVMSPDGPSAFPPVGGDTTIVDPKLAIAALTHDYEARSKALRSEMLTLKQSDGGQLTREHQSYLQQKLMRLLDAYHSALQRNDPMAVNADGTLTR